jgi:tetratricopeptide (TPR) repeat protein
VDLAPANYRSLRLIYQGITLYRAGEFADAARKLEEGLREAATGSVKVGAVFVARGHFFLALARHRLGQADAARDALRQARDVARAELPALGWSHLGTGWHDLLGVDLARREAEALVEGQATPDPAEHVHRARLYARLGEPAKAEAELAVAAAARPDDALVWRAHGWVLTELGQKEQAAAAFAKAKQLQPEDANTAAARGRQLAKQGNVAEAAAAFASALEQTTQGKQMTWFTASPLHDEVAGLDSIFDQVAALRPQDLRLWAGRTERLGRQGRWKEAADAVERVVALNPADHWVWYQQAPLLLFTGDREGYRRVCRQMLTRFSESEQTYIAERTAKTCLLAPDAVDDPRILVRLTTYAVSGGAKEKFFKYYCLARGLAGYRAGQFAEAIDWLNRSLTPGAEVVYLDGISHVVLAMAQHRLGRPNEARQALAEARRLVEAKAPGVARGDYGLAWADWLRYEILRREAEAMVQ